MLNGYYIESKILLYLANIHTKQKDYKTHNNITDTSTINIIDSNFLESDKCCSSFTFTEKIKCNQEKKLQMHIIELPKFKFKNVNNINKKEAWIAFLKGNDDFLENNNIQFEQIKRLNNILDKYWKSEII